MSQSTVVFVLPSPIKSVVRTTASDESVDSVVCIPGPAEPVNDVMPCWTGDEEHDDYGGMLSCPGPGPMSRSTVLFVLPGPMSRSTVLFVLPGPMSRSTVLFVLQ